MASEVKAVKIEKFVIKIGDKVLELTPLQAAELRDILDKSLGRPTDELKKLFEEFERKKEKEYIPVPYPHPYPVWPEPYRPWPIWRNWEIICSTPTTQTTYTTCNITCKA
jgi:hypothetical protein